MPFKINFQNNTWEITDDKGYRYFFTTNESYIIDGSYTDVNTWHLTKIYYQSILLIDIVYDNWLVTPLPSFSEVRNIFAEGYIHSNFGSDQIKRSLTHVSQMNTKYPKYITVGLDSIVFDKAARTDLVGAPQLSSISIISRANKNLVKKISFKTSYFNGDPIGADVSTQPNVVKRLKLDSVQIFSNQAKPLIYKFIYFEGLPYKSSFSQDYWGYFNGANNLTDSYIESPSNTPFSTVRTLVPRTSSLAYENIIPEKILSNKGADRGG